MAARLGVKLVVLKASEMVDWMVGSKDRKLGAKLAAQLVSMMVGMKAEQKVGL